MQVAGDRDTILRTRWWVAPALARTVVRADGGVLRHGRRNPASPISGGLSQAGYQHDCGTARAGAVDIQATPPDVDETPLHRRRTAVDLFLNRLVAACDPGNDKRGEHGIQH